MATEREGKPSCAISGEIYGVAFLLEAGSAETLQAMVDSLGSLWSESRAAREPVQLRVMLTDHETYRLERDGHPLSTGSLDTALDTLGGVVRRYVAFHAPNHVFVHAGAVVHAGRALVVPGDSFSGKSTLVAALVRAGGSYFSDEYAVLDSEGTVHPYLKPIALREQPGSPSQTNYHVDELGGRASETPVPLGLVVVTRYRRGAQWAPEPLSAAELVIEMFGNTYLGATRPEQSMRTLRAAIAGATGLKGDRGEALEIADELLAIVAEQTAHHRRRLSLSLEATDIRVT